MSAKVVVKNLRLFICGIADQKDAAAVDAHAQSLPDVIGSRVLVNGLCIIQMATNMVTVEAEQRMLKHMTFDK